MNLDRQSLQKADGRRFALLERQADEAGWHGAPPMRPEEALRVRVSAGQRPIWKRPPEPCAQVRILLGALFRIPNREIHCRSVATAAVLAATAHQTVCVKPRLSPSVTRLSRQERAPTARYERRRRPQTRPSI